MAYWLEERVQDYSVGAISLAEFDASVQGWITYLHHTDTWGRRQQVLDTPLRRLENPATRLRAAHGFLQCARLYVTILRAGCSL